jgi:hypothetical protein
MQAAVARPTTSSISKVSRTAVYKLLDEDLDDIICYVHPGDNPDKNGALPQQMLEQAVK